MTGYTNHSIKRVALVEEKVNKSGQEEPSLLQAEMEEILYKDGNPILSLYFQIIL